MATGTWARGLPAFSPLHSRHLHLNRVGKPNEIAELLRDARALSPYATSSSLIGSFLDHKGASTSGGSPLMRRTHRPSPLSHPSVESAQTPPKYCILAASSPSGNLAPQSSSLEDSLGPVNISLERTAMHQRLAASPRPRDAPPPLRETTPPAAGSSTNIRAQLSIGQGPAPIRARPRGQMMMSPMDIPTNAGIVTRSVNGTYW